MNIFGVGGAEFILIVLIMLVVAGPQRMIRWAYIMGQWVGKFRIIWAQMVDGIEKEMRESGMDVNLPRELPNRQNINQWANEAMKPYKDELDKEFNSVKDPLVETVKETDDMLKTTAKEVAKDTRPRPTFRQPEGGAVAFGKVAEATAMTNNDNEDTAADSAPDKAGGEQGSETAGLGAWANPQHPSQQVQQTDRHEGAS